MARAKPSLLSDVARMAGVSLATASRTLSEPNLVHPETRERVRKVIAKLGYVPHGAARALVTRKSNTVGAVIPTLDNPIFASSVQALQQRLAEAHFTLLLGSHEYDLASEVRVVSALIERGVDGLILVGIDHEPAVYAMLHKVQVPYELTWTLDGGHFHHCLGFSNREAAALVTAHLLGLGHTEIAMVSGQIETNDRARERVAGVRDALEARGLELKPELFVETSFSVESGRHALARLLKTQRRFTAVVCGNDILALGVLTEATARRIAVPAQLSITGFDDIDMAREVLPGLTTVRLPVGQIGRRAAERMLARIAGDEVIRVEKVDVEFIQRGSSGTAPRIVKAKRARAAVPTSGYQR